MILTHIYIYIYVHICLFVYLFISPGGLCMVMGCWSDASAEICGEGDRRLRSTQVRVSVKQTLLSYEPLPCNPTPETARQPLIWCSESMINQGSSSPEECFFHRHRYELSVKWMAVCDTQGLDREMKRELSSHEIKAQDFKVRVSNPRSKLHLDLKVPF